ncbi:MAG: TIGR00730 family Rossman fold protein [Bacteroidales bacterium]|nr:TIGR00730 family Rossman fold protein [Bacteroidales bacterium]
MKSVGVFCGSSMGIRPGYRQGAIELGGILLKRRIQLIYGGANVGLMKVLADTVLAGGGEVIGIMPRRLVENEVAHQGLTKMHIVESMSERKTLMVELSDAFIAMPGGFGTFDELAEVITYNQLRLTDKPIGILNLEHYFDHLLKFFTHTANEGFLRHEHRNNLIVEEKPEELLNKLSRYQPVSIEKWIRDIKEESK